MKKSILAIVLLTSIGIVAQGQQVQPAKKRSVVINPAVIEYPRQTLTLYPNPASDKFNIDLPIKKGESFMLEIYGKPGTRVLSKKWNGEKIDVSTLPTGIYIVTLKRKQEVYSQKLLVNR